jgi:methylase of polypeptide subunit release factors
MMLEGVPPPVAQQEVLAWLRERLRGAEYTEEAVCERLEVASPAMLDPHHYPYYRRCLAGRDPAAALIGLFLLQQETDADELRAALGPDAPERLEAIGLIATRGTTPGTVRPQIDLYPYRGLWVATDRSDPCGEQGVAAPPDAVMDLNLSSHALAQVTLPITPGSRVLDLGTGCGVHALLAARAGATAVGTDLNPRALAFARFNAALNDLADVAFVPGDLYAPVAGETFDRILVNPAFILTPAPRVLFRDGGARGDAMSRAAIEGAPAHLSPGGIAQVVGEFPTIAGETFEERVAGWMEGSGCDLLLLRFSTLSAADYATLYSQEPFGQNLAEYERAWQSRWDAFEGLEIEEIAFGAVLLRRRAAGEPWGAFRAASLEMPLGERIESFLATRDRLDDPGFPPPGSRPRMATGLLLVDGRQWEGAGWQEQEGHASLPGDPFLPEAVLASGARELLLLCDGTRATAEILAAITADSDDPAGTLIAARGALRDLIERGLVEV